MTTGDFGDLIQRMTRLEPGVDSADSVSWRAYREAETLDDPAVAALADAYLAAPCAPTQRLAVFRVLGCLVRNGHGDACRPTLLAHLGVETNRDALAALLDALAAAGLPAGFDDAPIAALLTHRWGAVREAAARLLAS